MFLSILITHYNRPEALQKCIIAFKDLNLNVDYELVVSDDGSNFENQEALKQIPNIKLIISQENKGLGANINRGLANCSGDYILYCQEDFLIRTSFVSVFDDVVEQLKSGNIDMVRLTANYYFPYLIPISETVSKIPKIAMKNFLYNAFQYSDNPFIVKKDFFIKNGFYLESVKGHYCETEYAIRIMKSKSKIGILKKYVFDSLMVDSVLNFQNKVVKKGKRNRYKKVYRYLRAFRQHLECLFYDNQKRTLITYKKKAHKI